MSKKLTNEELAKQVERKLLEHCDRALDLEEVDTDILKVAKDVLKSMRGKQAPLEPQGPIGEDTVDLPFG